MADLGLSKLLDSLFSPPTWIKVAARSSLIEKCIALHLIISRQNRIWPFIPGVNSSLELTAILRQHGVLVVRPARVDGSLRFSSEVLSCL